MCGILAIHDPAGGVSEAEIRRGLGAMRHRGPDGRRTVIASEAKALFAVGVPAAWDPGAMWQVCGMQYPLPGQTLFRGVHQVEPGGLFLSLQQGLTCPSLYWDIRYPVDVGDQTP